MRLLVNLWPRDLVVSQADMINVQRVKNIKQSDQDSFIENEMESMFLEITTISQNASPQKNRKNFVQVCYSRYVTLDANSGKKTHLMLRFLICKRKGGRD